MIIKVSEAKTKACAFDLSKPCQATDCMAWLYAETPEFKHNAEFVYRRDGRRLVADTGLCSRLP